MFGGIGGFRHGLEQASDKYECVDYIEYDKYAVKSYNEIFKEEHSPRDVTKLSKQEIPEHDLLCAGFPCQSFSVAGNRQGTDEARGKLFREIVRIAEAKRPKMLLLENVKGILSQKVVQDGESIPETKGHAFTEVLQALHELGYCLEWQVLNSKNWGVPQNRERVFIVGHLGGEPQRKVFPIEREDRGDTGEDGGELEIDEVVNRYGEGKQDGGVYGKGGVSPTLAVSKGGANPFMVTEEGLNTAEDGSAYTIDASYWKGTSPGDIGSGRRTQIIQNHRNIEIRNHGQESPTLNKKQGGGQLPMVLNHQFRPETRPSIKDSQSGGSGLLYNSDYSYALSSSPHYLVDDSFLAMEDELRTYTDIAPSQRGERHNMKVVQIPRGRNSNGKHFTFPTVSSNSWHENNFLQEVQPVHTPDFAEKDMNMKSRVGSEDGSMFTVDGSSQHGVTDRKRIRKLTPKECWRLQGFPDTSFEAAQEVNSDTQLYKQAGNAVTVNVIKALGEEIQVYFGETNNV